MVRNSPSLSSHLEDIQEMKLSLNQWIRTTYQPIIESKYMSAVFFLLLLLYYNFFNLLAAQNYSASGEPYKSNERMKTPSFSLKHRAKFSSPWKASRDWGNLISGGICCKGQVPPQKRISFWALLANIIYTQSMLFLTANYFHIPVKKLSVGLSTSSWNTDWFHKSC